MRALHRCCGLILDGDSFDLTIAQALWQKGIGKHRGFNEKGAVGAAIRRGKKRSVERGGMGLGQRTFVRYRCPRSAFSVSAGACGSI